ncbi:MAG: hypothetical protein Q7S93_08845 [Phenylobacterium sp.]|nr:hypothetical protein [Phenylobacterium sp.]MDO8410155.1 hypothetical protein [Phenylobacterium sp.]
MGQPHPPRITADGVAYLRTAEAAFAAVARRPSDLDLFLQRRGAA